MMKVVKTNTTDTENLTMVIFLPSEIPHRTAFTTALPTATADFLGWKSNIKIGSAL